LFTFQSVQQQLKKFAAPAADAAAPADGAAAAPADAEKEGCLSTNLASWFG
jgi:hypothetical protein